MKRIKMPCSASGRAVPDKFGCSGGHLHPSPMHADKCERRYRDWQRENMPGVNRAIGVAVFVLLTR